MLSTAEFFEQAEKTCVLYLRPDMYGNVQKDSFRIQEGGYQYYIENLKRLPCGQSKASRVVEVNPESKFKLYEDKKIGKVDKIIVL